MRFDCGAAESVVNSTGCEATLLSDSVWFFGSIALTMMPAAPAATRSSSMRCCTAAAACSGYLNCSSYFGSSPCAFLTPASAPFQKSDAPLTTKARIFLSAACAEPRPNAVANTTDAPAIKRRFIETPPLCGWPFFAARYCVADFLCRCAHAHSLLIKTQGHHPRRGNAARSVGLSWKRSKMRHAPQGSRKIPHVQLTAVVAVIRRVGRYL